MDFNNKPLGRNRRNQWEDVQKFPASAGLPATVENVESTVYLPAWHKTWDQGSEGACVGFAASMMMSMINERQASLEKLSPVTRRYNPWWLWKEARLVDGWAGNDDLNVSEGTWVNAACKILRDKGHCRVINGRTKSADIAEGISTYRWATSVDLVRTAISQNIPVAIGVDWYTNFDSPQKNSVGEYWIGENDLGTLRGGHAVPIYRASDKRQAFKIKNSWADYPLVWMSYTTFGKLLADDGEALLITDK